MKTNILKWDYRLLLVLSSINAAAMLSCFYIGYFSLFIEAIVVGYQFVSNGLHLFLNHKSIGFKNLRVYYLTITIVYALLIAVAIYYNPFNRVLFVVALMLIPQLLTSAYTWLCKKELNFLERREFHILK
jgi:hypothetical protein